MFVVMAACLDYFINAFTKQTKDIGRPGVTIQRDVSRMHQSNKKNTGCRSYLPFSDATYHFPVLIHKGI
jgi:hypothetical protein